MKEQKYQKIQIIFYLFFLQLIKLHYLIFIVKYFIFNIQWSQIFPDNIKAKRFLLGSKIDLRNKEKKSINYNDVN